MMYVWNNDVNASGMIEVLVCRESVAWTSNPTNDAALINCWLSSDAESFVTKHRLSTQISSQMRKHVCATYSNWVSILHTTIGGWEAYPTPNIENPNFASAFFNTDKI